MFAPTEYDIVGTHQRIALAAAARWLAKPEAVATCIILQAETENIRYRLDGTPATATVGFQLAAGQITTIPTVVGGVSVCREADGAVVQYQWIS